MSDATIDILFQTMLIIVISGCVLLIFVIFVGGATLIVLSILNEVKLAKLARKNMEQNMTRNDIKCYNDSCK